MVHVSCYMNVLERYSENNKKKNCHKYSDVYMLLRDYYKLYIYIYI